jgi:hypothetical protein
MHIFPIEPDMCIPDLTLPVRFTVIFDRLGFMRMDGCKRDYIATTGRYLLLHDCRFDTYYRMEHVNRIYFSDIHLRHRLRHASIIVENHGLY